MTPEESTGTATDGLRFSVEVASGLVESGLEVVVTGARGWLGRATLEMLESALGPNMNERVHAFGSSPGLLALRSGSRLQVRALTELPDVAVGPHLMAHFAFATREHVSEQGLRQYVAGNRSITKAITNHLSDRMPYGLFVTSSGAVYLGNDLASNPYGVLKLEDERTFLDVTRRGTSRCRTVIPRLFNLAGPFLNKPAHYVLGSILEDIRRGGRSASLPTDLPCAPMYTSATWWVSRSPS